MKRLLLVLSLASLSPVGRDRPHDLDTRVRFPVPICDQCAGNMGRLTWVFPMVECHQCGEHRPWIAEWRFIK